MSARLRLSAVNFTCFILIDWFSESNHARGYMNIIYYANV